MNIFPPKRCAWRLALLTFHIAYAMHAKVTTPIAMVLIMVAKIPSVFSTARATHEKMKRETLPRVRRKVMCLVVPIDIRESLAAVGDVASMRDAR